MKAYDQYIKIEQEIAKLTEKKEALREKILKDIQKSGETNKKTDFGTFSIVKRTTYKFSDSFELLQSSVNEKIKNYKNRQMKAVDKLREEEIENGIAKTEEHESLRFSPAKPKKSKSRVEETEVF